MFVTTVPVLVVFHVLRGLSNAGLDADRLTSAMTPAPWTGIRAAMGSGAKSDLWTRRRLGGSGISHVGNRCVARYLPVVLASVMAAGAFTIGCVAARYLATARRVWTEEDPQRSTTDDVGGRA